MSISIHVRFIHLGVLLALLLLVACSKDKPHPSKIEEFLGTWSLERIGGGISGLGYDANFDHMQIQSDFAYELRQGTHRINGGLLQFSTTSMQEIVIEIMPDTLTNQQVLIFEETDKLVSFEENQRVLILSDICCDLFSYHFRKEN